MMNKHEDFLFHLNVKTLYILKVVKICNDYVIFKGNLELNCN